MQNRDSRERKGRGSGARQEGRRGGDYRQTNGRERSGTRAGRTAEKRMKKLGKKTREKEPPGPRRWRNKAWLITPDLDNGILNPWLRCGKSSGMYNGTVNYCKMPKLEEDRFQEEAEQDTCRPLCKHIREDMKAPLRFSWLKMRAHCQGVST